MSTTPVTPQPSSSIPPSVVNSSPSAAPSAPAPSSPATASPESAVPQAQPNAAAHEPSTPELSPQDFDSLQDYAQALIDKKSTASRDLRQSEEESSAAPQEQPAAPQAEQTQAEQKDEVLPKQETAELPDLDLQSEDFLSAKALDDKINANAAVKQALEADQPLREAIFRNARMVGDAAAFKELFPDVESARHAADLAIAYNELDHAFSNANTREGAEQFMAHWKQLATMQDGLSMHPAWTTVNQHLFDSQLDFVRRRAEQAGDHELVAALDVVRESVPGSAAAAVFRSGALNELPPHLRAAAESISRREQELSRQIVTQQQRDAQAFEDSTGQEADDRISALVEPTLEKAALPEFVRQTAREKIARAITESLENNRFFQSRLGELARMPRNEETRQQRLNLVMSHVQAVAGPIVRQVLREASQPVMQAQEDRRSKIENQIARSRSEPRSVGGAASLSTSRETPEQLLASAKAQLRDELGDEPTMSQVIERFAKLRKTSI